MSDNSMLTVLALLERTDTLMKSGTREQLDKSILVAIEQLIQKAFIKFQESDCDNTIFLYYFQDIIDIVTALVSTEGFDRTDTVTKDLIVNKIHECLSMLYLEVGKYYTSMHSFDYNYRLNPLLQRVVDNCIHNGYYFEKV